MRFPLQRRRGPAAGRRRPVGTTTLYRRLFGAYVLSVALALAVLIFAPVTISVPVALTELVGLLVGFLVMLGMFTVLLHRALSPLERLTGLMDRIDPLAPGQRIAVDAREIEVVALADTFNRMLDRLEGERRASARRALAAQEAERQRIARELHDEIGQLLTGIVLRTETLVRRAPDDLRADLEALRESARGGAEEVREIARRIRPEALDELGLQSALLALCSSFSDRSGLRVVRQLESGLPLTDEQELVIYRVAQESLTNVLRHAQATGVEVALHRDDAGGVVLQVRDDGRGLDAGPPDPSSAGIRGMRERALLVAADLSVATGAVGGTEVRLVIPQGELP